MVPKQPIVYQRGWVRAFPNDRCKIFFLKYFYLIKNSSDATMYKKLHFLYYTPIQPLSDFSMVKFAISVKSMFTKTF